MVFVPRTRTYARQRRRSSPRTPRTGERRASIEALAPVAAPTVAIAGVSVTHELVASIAAKLDGSPAGDWLTTGLENETRILGLDIDEREAILRALDDPPAGLEELRGVLLREHVWRQREGL